MGKEGIPMWGGGVVGVGTEREGGKGKVEARQGKRLVSAQEGWEARGSLGMVTWPQNYD
jgi:hypothetical protein